MEELVVVLVAEDDLLMRVFRMAFLDSMRWHVHAGTDMGNCI